MLMLDNADLARACAMPACIEALYQGLAAYARGDAIRRPRIDMFTPTSRPGEYGCFSTMDGVIRGGYYALRIKPDVISWPVIGGKHRRITYCKTPGLYGGLVLLFRADNAELVAIMNDSYVQHMRVGALAGLGAKYTTAPDAQTVGIIGSGGMARSFAQGFAAVRPVRQIKAYSPNRSNLEAYCVEMTAQLGIEVIPGKSAQQVAEGVDILAACTNSADPVVLGDWIEPGMHLAASTPWEFGADVWRRVTKIGYLLDRTALDASAFVDDNFEIRQTVLAYLSGSSQERNAIPEKKETMAIEFSPDQFLPCVDWERGAACFEAHPDDITVLSEVSTMVGRFDGRIRPGLASDGIQGLQFAAVAGKAYELARDLGVGRELPSEWFLQDTPT